MLKSYDFLKFLFRSFVHEAKHILKTGNIPSARKTTVLCIFLLGDFCFATTSRFEDLGIFVVDKNNSAIAGYPF